MFHVELLKYTFLSIKIEDDVNNLACSELKK